MSHWLMSVNALLLACLSSATAADTTVILTDRAGSSGLSFSSIPPIHAELWRKEFGGPDAAGDSSTGRSPVSVLHAGMLRSAAPAVLPAFLQSVEMCSQVDGLAALALGPVPAAAGSGRSRARGGVPESGASDALSEWEKITLSVGTADPFASYTGPSLTTYLVGFVAMIVVAGAILSPGRGTV